MQIETGEVRNWIMNYKDEFDTKNPTPFAEGIVLACNGLLKLLANYEEIEGTKIAKELDK